MILNPGKFQARIFDKRKRNHTNQLINIYQKEINAVSKVKLLGIDIDVKLKYNHHIKNICKSVSNQLNALIKSKHLLRFEERKMLGNTFAMSNFSCYPLVWTFSKRALPQLTFTFSKSTLEALEKDMKYVQG